MTWTLAAHRSELAKDGDYVSLPGLTVYNRVGELIAWNGLCSHRGARIFDYGTGKRPLVCPYHGLKDRAITDKVTRLLTAWVGNFLFVGDGSAHLFEQLGKLHGLLIAMSNFIDRAHSFDTLRMDCPWNIAIENTLEDYHVASVHPNTFGRLGVVQVESERHAKNSIAHYTVTDDRTVRGLTRMAEHFKHVRPHEYFHMHLYPWTCLSSVGGFSYSLQHYFPDRPGSTLLCSRLYAPHLHEGAPDLSFFFDEARTFNQRVFREDAEICARVSGSGSFLFPNEQRLAWFRSANGPG